MGINKDNVDIRETIKAVVKKNKGDLTPQEIEMQEDALIKIFEQGMLPVEAQGFNDDFLEDVYAFAYTLYQQNKIEEASQLYRWLNRMIPVNEKYIAALIHCFILQKKWAGAVSYLMRLAYLNPEDPLPFVKMSECLIEANDFPEALIVLDKAIQRAEGKPEYAKEIEKWRLDLQYIISHSHIDPAIIDKFRSQKRKEKNKLKI